MVLVITACPAGLRGDITKWVMEISPGVFVGRPSARIRDVLWDRTVSLCKDGRALLVYSSNNEQGLEFRTHHHDWVPTDFDGLKLMVRPTADGKKSKLGGAARSGWAKARYQRKR
ncbi:type I-E CRISPR-associated endoribonuclease Cas2e [Corynebacterium flavescens]|uniref:type I-E CRISPR-associated endoribonuclease Cas2e n=1 Tax=Corynebacterium flavescens TaxID=28028 RepID=UPI003FD1E0D0